MLARGWELVKKARWGCAYMRAPEGFSRPIVVESLIPTKDEILRLANDLHTRDVQWQGIVGEWPAFYIRSYEVEQYRVDPFTDKKSPLPPINGCPFHSG